MNRCMMVGRGPDGLPKVMEVDADGYLKGISDLVVGDHREKVYPWDVEITLAAGASNTWGDCKVVVPIDGVVDDYGRNVPPTGPLMNYKLTGLSLISVANPAQGITWRLYRIAKATSVTLDADSGAAHAPTTWIRIPDTSGFQADDVIWVMDDNTTDGEIRVVSSITTDDHLLLTVALANNYTVAQNAKVYLIRRGDGDSGYRCIWGKYQAGGVNNMRRIYFYAPKICESGDGVLAEAYDRKNTVTPGSVGVTAYYDYY